MVVQCDDVINYAIGIDEYYGTSYTQLEISKVYWFTRLIVSELKGFGYGNDLYRGSIDGYGGEWAKPKERQTL